MLELLELFYRHFGARACYIVDLKSWDIVEDKADLIIIRAYNEKEDSYKGEEKRMRE
jgi:hypothetical protein